MCKRNGVVLTVFCCLALGTAMAANDPSSACLGLKMQSIVDARIEDAKLVQPGPVPPDNNPYHPPYPKEWVLPAYCQVRGVVHERKGTDGAQYGDRFELRMPDPWNGKFLFQGGGGTDGVVAPALGIVNYRDLPALSRGYAVVSTDSGHAGGDNTAFGREQQARLDYAYNSIGEVTTVAKRILVAYYQKTATRSYFIGCSNGGREAMIAVQRYPLEFDGAVAGDPGFDLSHAAIAEAWDTEAFNAAAPKDSQNRPILSRAFSKDDLSLVVKHLLDKCDDLDGLRDGEINNIAACHFDPEVLVCSGEKAPQCLSQLQVDALKHSFGGAHDSKGNPLYSSWPYDAGIADFGWRIWKLGTSDDGTPNAINTTLGVHALADYFVHPYLPEFDPAHVDFDAIAAQVESTHAINDAISTDLGTFAGKGGKLLIYEGTSDPVFSADDLVAYYNRFASDNGGMEKAHSVARLFLVPGMNHCGGGPATDQFDALTALEDWVENVKAPERIVAQGSAFPGRTRPLCPYPQYAEYNGSGDSEKAENFTCK